MSVQSSLPSASRASSSRLPMSEVTVANLHEQSSLTTDLLREDDPAIQQEILLLIAEHLASVAAPGLPHTLAALKEEMELRSREEDDRDSERERLAGRLLDGDWSEVERLLAADPGLVRNLKAFQYKFYRQQFLELIEARESQKAFNLLIRRLKPLEHYQSYPTEHRELSYLLSARSVAEAGASFAGWGGPAEGREELVDELRGMSTAASRQGDGARGVQAGSGAGGEVLADAIGPDGTSAGGASAGSSPYIPPNRLMTLLRQAAAWQVYFSRYHPKVVPTIHTLLHDYSPFVIPNTLKDTYRSHSANIKTVKFLGSSGTRIISGSSDTTLSIHHTTSAPHSGPSRLLGHTSRVWDVDATDSGAFAASASGDGTVRIWETENEGKCLAVLGGGPAVGDVYSVKWAKGGKNQVISGGYDKKLSLWDVDRQQVVKTFTGHTAPVTSTAFSPPSTSSSPILVSGSSDRTIRLWDVSSGVLVHSIASSLGEISSVDVDQKGQNLLVSSKDNSNMVFDMRVLSRPLHRFGTHQNTSKTHIRSSFLSPASNLIVGGSEDGLIYLWSLDNTHSDQPVATLAGHKGGPVYEAVWNERMGLLASCGEDRTVRTWVWEEESQEGQGVA